MRLVAGVEAAGAELGAHQATSSAAGAASAMRRSRPSQSETAILPSEARLRRQALLQHHVEIGGRHPLRHGLGREAQSAVGVLVAQELELVRREIDDQQPPGRAQHAGGLVDRARAVVQEVQHLVDDDDVEGIPRQRQVVDVALAHAAMLEPGAVEPGAGDRQHIEREIEAEAALDRGAEQLEHPPGAGAEIEQGADLGARQGAGDGLLDGVIGDMQLADPVPLGGVATEIGLRDRLPLRPHRCQPLAIARERRVGRVEPGNEIAGELGGPAPLAQAEEGPRPFAEPVDQPGLGQEPQMPRDARLRLAQDVGEVRDRQLGLGRAAPGCAIACSPRQP